MNCWSSLRAQGLSASPAPLRRPLKEAERSVGPETASSSHCCHAPSPGCLGFSLSVCLTGGSLPPNPSGLHSPTVGEDRWGAEEFTHSLPYSQPLPSLLTGSCPSWGGPEHSQEIFAVTGPQTGRLLSDCADGLICIAVLGTGKGVKKYFRDISTSKFFLELFPPLLTASSTCFSDLHKGTPPLPLSWLILAPSTSHTPSPIIATSCLSLFQDSTDWRPKRCSSNDRH